MKVLDPGHAYDLDWLDGEPVNDDNPWMPLNRLIFVKREGEGYPGNVGHHPGTNLQEVLRACIDRVKYLDNQIPHPRNDDVLQSLRRAIFDLEVRAAERHGRLYEFYAAAQKHGPEIETMSVCPRCGHIKCQGDCRGHSQDSSSQS